MTIRLPCVVALLLAIPATALSQEGKPKPLVRISLKERAEAKQVPVGEYVPGEKDQPDALKFVNSEPAPKTFAFLELEPPNIGTRTYAIRGNVRYENVNGNGYLEMWSQFSQGGTYFSKTLAEAGGPLGVIRGTSNWREFVLPYDKGDQLSPEKLTVNLVLPGRGVVAVSDLELVAPATNMFGTSAAGWWPEQTAAWVGSIGGSLFGVFVGCVLAPLVATGRARMFVFISLGALAGCGLLGFVTGLAALCVGQPYHVYYPALLLGGMGLFFGIGCLAMARFRYSQHDLRRMSALDAG